MRAWPPCGMQGHEHSHACTLPAQSCSPLGFTQGVLEGLQLPRARAPVGVAPLGDVVDFLRQDARALQVDPSEVPPLLLRVQPLREHAQVSEVDVEEPVQARALAP